MPAALLQNVTYRSIMEESARDVQYRVPPRDLFGPSVRSDAPCCGGAVRMCRGRMHSLIDPL